MFCVIQKIKRKQQDRYGAHKRIELVENEELQRYSYCYSSERFGRPILDAYKISMHHSYREAGKVKKQQWSVTTMGYYDVVEYDVSDCVRDIKIKEVAEASGVAIEEIWQLIYLKFEPLQDKLRNEFEQSEEYLTNKRNKYLEKDYHNRKKIFEDLYGFDTYSRCYDFYGNLRNAEYLHHLKIKREQEAAYQRESERVHREYQEQGSYSSSYYASSSSNYEENERIWLKEIYRMASKKFHPDAAGGSDEKMKFLTKLKEQWGL